MTYSISLPLSGLAGWELLKRTQERQSATFEKQGTIQRDDAYFREKIGSITTAEQLVNDRRLLRISLEAFGLEADVNAKAFIRKVLESETLTTDSFAVNLTDPKYKALASAFGFGDYATPRTVLSDFPDEILDQWKERRFESAVGDSNNDYRLALNARRELAELADSSSSENTKWLRVLGDAPLWEVVRQAMNLPASFVNLDLDQQLSGLKQRAESLFGEEGVSQFTDEAKVEKLIQRFLVTSSASTASSVSNPALVLLQQASLFRRV